LSIFALGETPAAKFCVRLAQLVEIVVEHRISEELLFRLGNCLLTKAIPCGTSLAHEMRRALK
jgi:hypothetical protein